MRPSFSVDGRTGPREDAATIKTDEAGRPALVTVPEVVAVVEEADRPEVVAALSLIHI